MKTIPCVLKVLLLCLMACPAAILRGQSEDAVAVASEVDSRPVPLKTPPPTYPYSMKRDGVEGVVAVKALINEAGAVSECNVVKSSHAEFEVPALDAVRKWKFKPASKGGNPVKMRVVIPIKFSQEG